MINTNSANGPPPPVPPRPGASQSLELAISQSSMQNRTRSHIRILSAVFVAQTVVTIALFLYLFQRTGSASVSQTEGKVEGLLAPGTPSGTQALAQMTVKQSSVMSSNKILQWNRDHSTLKNVEHFTMRGTLQICIPGYYYVYSQVTFSKMHPKIPLAQTVMSRKSLEGEAGEDLLLKAFCSLKTGTGEICTSYQGGIFRLEEGQQLSVNVTDLSLVNYEATATTFGLFLLKHIP